MANGIDEFSESAVVDVEGVKTLEKSDVDFSIPWLLAFFVAIIAMGLGWGASKVKKQATGGDGTSSGTEDTK